jgi:hypothetical protein
MLKDVYETNRALDSKVRRAAKKFGLRAEKSCARNHHGNNQGGWQLIDPYRKEVVEGVDYEFTPERVIGFTAGYKASNFWLSTFSALNYSRSIGHAGSCGRLGLS